MEHRSQHPVNRATVDEAPLGARVADAVTGFMGSWRFIVLQTVIVAIWVAGNVYHVLNVGFKLEQRIVAALESARR